MRKTTRTMIHAMQGMKGVVYPRDLSLEAIEDLSEDEREKRLLQSLDHDARRVLREWKNPQDAAEKQQLSITGEGFDLEDLQARYQVSPLSDQAGGYRPREDMSLEDINHNIELLEKSRAGKEKRINALKRYRDLPFGAVGEVVRDLELAG